jgi:transposase
VINGLWICERCACGGAAVSCVFHVNSATVGGVPQLLVLDNLKSGVITPNFFSPDLNPTYHDLACHYGAAIQAYRAALGILRLAKTYGPDRLEAACGRALKIQSVTYRSIVEPKLLYFTFETTMFIR